MRVRFLFIIALFLIFGTVTHAVPLIMDGSFEENCSDPSSCTYGTNNATVAIGNDWNWSEVGTAAGTRFAIIRDTLSAPRATSGVYYASLQAGSEGTPSEGFLTNLQLLNGGKIYFDVNQYSQGSTNGQFRLQYVFSDTSLSAVDIATYGFGGLGDINNGKLDVNYQLPNLPGYIRFRLTQSGSFTSAQELIMDNVRWERYPIILFRDPPYTTHVLDNQPFTIDLTYYAGFNCTVSDGLGNTYNTEYIGDEIYRTEEIEYSLTDPSQIIFFSTQCNSITNASDEFKLKINRDQLISHNGGFDTNGTGSTTSTTTSQFEDWEVLENAGTGGIFSVLENTLITRPSTDGLNYAHMHLDSSTDEWEIRSMNSVRGGTLYYDLNSVTGTGADLGNFLIIFYPDTGGGSVLYDVNFETLALQVGQDLNATIPDESGEIAFRFVSDTTGVVDVLFDNIRVTNSPSYLVLSTSPALPIVNENITFDANFFDINNNPISGACSIQVDDPQSTSVFSHDMNFDSSTGTYKYEQSFEIPGSYVFDVNCSATGYSSVDDTGFFTVYESSPSVTGMIITDIENVTHNYVFDFNVASLDFVINDVNFFPGIETGDIIFSIENTAETLQDININVLNSLIDGRQYFIYTATQTQYDANVWQFDDSGTFGNTSSTPIQKIWHEELGQYIYSQNYSIGGLQKVYFKLTYKKPHQHWFSINGNPDWFTNLEPTVNDQNTILVDQYFISNFSNIYSYLLQEVPDIFGDETQAFEFQFTVWTDTSNVEMLVGQTINGSDSTTSVTLGFTPHTYSFTINATDFDSQVLFKTNENQTAKVFITDYSIVPRGYFTKRLELFKENGDFLDLFLLNNQSMQYITEGLPFKVNTQAYDREGNLVELVVESYFDTVGADANKVSNETIQLETELEKTFDFDQTLQGIVDLNGNAVNPTIPRDFIVKASLLDDEGNVISIQSQAIKFVQFPYFGGDFSINFLPTEKRKGKKPAGIITISSDDIDTLEGLDIRIYDQNTNLTNPDYQTRIYKDTDFTCIGSTCNFQLTIDDFLFEDANVVHFVVTALLNTEYFSLTNPLIQADRIILLSQIEFDTAKIHQQIERTDNTYRPDEEIPLVLVLKSNEADTVQDNVEVYLTLQNCDAASGGNCTTQSTKFYPTGHLYDDKYNYDYYFFRHFYILDNGSPLPDGNYVGVHATIIDKTGIIQTLIPVLANKCKNNDIGSLFWPGALLSFLVDLLIGDGCNTPQEAIVSTIINNDQEIRLQIDSNRAVTSPSQEFFLCMNTDTNNVINQPLKANLTCAVWYEVAESPIDNFRFRMTNNYSDLTETGNGKQFVEFNVPYEIVAYNDLPLLKQELEASSNTSIDTVGEFFFSSFQLLAKDQFFTGKLNDYDSFVLGNGFITNIGGDLNFNQAFSPTTIGGVVFYRLNGFPIINSYEYRNNPAFNGNFDQLDKKQFIDFLISNDIDFPNNGAQMQLFVSDYSTPITLTDPNGKLVINETPDTQQINQSNLDSNSTTNYSFIPTILTINLSHTMFWNNFAQNSTLAMIMKLTLVITDNFFNNTMDFFNELTTDPASAIGSWFFSNLLYIAIAAGLLLAYAMIDRNLRNDRPSSSWRDDV